MIEGMPLRFGISSQGFIPFSGLVDEVAIFNRALSAAEIKSIYDAGSAGKAKPEAVSRVIDPKANFSKSG